VAVSKSAKPAKVPVKINWVGYDDEEWVAFVHLDTNLLKGAPTGQRTKEPEGWPERPGLSAEEIKAIDGYWRANNYLTVGQIYLHGQGLLLTQPLEHSNMKARLLGHWGTCPGLSSPAGSLVLVSTSSVPT